jgi:CRISPR-associated endonuclease/helicase Cas3
VTAEQFNDVFFALSGNEPMSWQWRLFHDHFAAGNFPPVIDLPTGLGKTMVMAIWLIARMHNKSLPRRLIYVVDRRTVVDQATTLATKFQRRAQALQQLARRRPELERFCSSFPAPAISTLRGQLADNRDWTRDLSRPAIIIGTVDLIGSALLFSGYRSSYKRRPLEAGLLGQDSLLVLDEAHLSKPFEKLLGTISDFQRSHSKPMQVVRMSATSSNGEVDDVFQLDTDPDSEAFDLWSELDEKGREKNQAKTRFEAKKRLTIVTLSDKEKLTGRLAGEAVRLAEDNSLSGKRIVVFVRKPDDAQSIADTIRKHWAKKNSLSPAESVEVLTGTMRGLERDKLVEKPVLKRFLDGDENPDVEESKRHVFLISTSAGEVGFDLNADHMLCDATTIDSLIQRLGRVNRRGWGDATVILVREPVKTKNGKPVELKGLDLAIANTLELVKDINGAKPENIASPKNIASFKSGIWKDQYAGACSPDLSTVELTDVLLDAWSMTSITDRMPGRPQVGPWLRGIGDELPQTTIAWRAELDEPGFADLALDDIEEWFDTHRILTHETLSVPTSTAAKWFTDRWNRLDDEQKFVVGSRFIVTDRAGFKLVTLNDVINQLGRKNTDSIRNAELILPASFGGIERGIGLLVPDAPKKPDDETEQNAGWHLAAPDIADIAPGCPRLREVITKAEDGETETKVIGNDGRPPKPPVKFRLDLESDNAKSIRLVSYLPRREKPEFGSQKQTLKQHVNAVEAEAKRIADDLHLKLGDPFREALILAAHYHDHGKNRERWQRTVNGTATVGTTDWMQQTELDGDGKQQCLGKSGDEMKRDPRGYRHEFGSICEFAFNAGKLPGDSRISQDVFDLAMHLIATHHGRGRPHFSKGGFDPDSESQSDGIHTESMRRFARLQRKYGWWALAWLENLLRCADALASADHDAEDDPDGSTDKEEGTK